jgi:hypothetical protein
LELATGPEEAPVLPVLPVFPVLPVLPVLPESELLVLLVELEDEEPTPDVGVVRAVPAPGRSWATTTPMATVAPVAATMAPRVSARSRDLALSLSAGVLGWPVTDMWRSSSVGDAPIPTCSNRH